MQRTLCTDLPLATPGETVRLQGWVHRRRALAAVTFLVVRDRSGLAQVVVRGGEVPPEETTVEVVGTATANAQAPGGVEVTDPVITSLTPAGGLAAGGNLVRIAGTNFTGTTGAAGVKIGGTNATGYDVISDGLIEAIAPPHAAGQVDVVVTNAAGASAATAQTKYTYS